MAVKKVIANLAKKSTELKKTQNDYYTGKLAAPNEHGYYSAEIEAHDDAGNVATANATTSEVLLLEVTKWREPNVNWLPTDRFNYVDYNRIKNNLEYLHEKAVELYSQFSIKDMGEEIKVYSTYWDVDIFNLFEQNLETINKMILTQDFGEYQTFYPNGAFITYDELNRIENAILSIKLLLDGQRVGKKRLAFRLGTFKEVKI